MKKIICWFAFILLTIAGYAQVRFYTGLSDQRITGNQTFQVQYVVEGAKDIQQFIVPDMPNFRVLEVFDHSSTTVAHTQTMQIVNVYSKIVVLSPKKNGHFTIPGATAVIDGKKRRSNAVKLTVMQLSSRPFTAPGGNDFSDINIDEISVIRPGETMEEKIKKNFFLKVDVNKTACYVGEPLMAVYKAYTRLNASSQVVRRPSFTGFSVTEMVDAYDGRPQIEILNRVPYYVSLIRKVQLFPLQEGEFELDKAEIESVIHFYKQPEGTSPNAPFYLGTPVDHHVDIETTPVKITVKPLPPDHQPEHYNGAVGKFDILLHAPKKLVHKGDLVKLQLVITGSGNLPLITPPVVNWPKGIDTTEPAVTEQTNKYVYPLTGNKTFEYSFAATDTGTYNIPPVRFSYYNIQQHAYQWSETSPVNLQVIPAVHAASNAVTPAAPAREEVSSSSIPRHMYWFGLVVIIIVTWISYQIWQLQKSKPVKKAIVEPEALQPGNMQQAPSPSEMLSGAVLALQQGNSQQFYREVQQALWQLVADKYNLLPLALNKRHIAVVLQEKKIPDEVINQLIAVIKECEWALYTPGRSVEDMEQLLERAHKVIADLSGY